MTFKFTHDANELYRAYRIVAVRQPGYRAIVVAFVLLPIAAVVREVADGAALLDAVWRNLVWIVLLPLWALQGIPLLYRLGTRRALARYPTLQGEQTIELTDEGVRIANSRGESRLAWESIRDATETDEFVFIHVTSKRAFHIPRRVISSGELPALRALLRANLPGRTRLLGPSAE